MLTRLTGDDLSIINHVQRTVNSHASDVDTPPVKNHSSEGMENFLGAIFHLLRRKWINSSDLSFDSSEVSFDSSEVSFDSSEEICRFLRGDF